MGLLKDRVEMSVSLNLWREHHYPGAVRDQVSRWQGGVHQVPFVDLEARHGRGLRSDEPLGVLRARVPTRPTGACLDAYPREGFVLSLTRKQGLGLESLSLISTSFFLRSTVQITPPNSPLEELPLQTSIPSPSPDAVPFRCP